MGPAPGVAGWAPGTALRGGPEVVRLRAGGLGLAAAPRVRGSHHRRLPGLPAVAVALGVVTGPLPSPGVVTEQAPAALLPQRGCAVSEATCFTAAAVPVHHSAASPVLGELALRHQPHNGQ